MGAAFGVAWVNTTEYTISKVITSGKGISKAFTSVIHSGTNSTGYSSHSHGVFSYSVQLKFLHLKFGSMPPDALSPEESGLWPFCNRPLQNLINKHAVRQCVHCNLRQGRSRSLRREEGITSLEVKSWLIFMHKP